MDIVDKYRGDLNRTTGNQMNVQKNMEETNIVCHTVQGEYKLRTGFIISNRIK